MTLLNQIKRILNKELTQELNNKFFINSVLLFSLLLIIILLFPFARIQVDQEIKNILFWVILYFASLSGFQNIFLKETDRGTTLYLKSNFNSQSVFWGKAIFNIISMYTVISIILIIYCTLFNFEELLHPVIFGFLLLIVISLGINGTLMSSLLSYSGNNSTLYAIIGFPILFPIFLIGINGTQEFLQLDSIVLISWISVLCYDVISILLAYLIFDFIWEQMY